MDLHNFEYLVTIEKYGSLSEAADHLYVSQPALSKALNKIEQSLGFEIFRRKKSGLEPTPQGLIYLRACDRILQAKKDMMLELLSQEVMAVPAAQLRIGLNNREAASDLIHILEKKQPLKSEQPQFVLSAQISPVKIDC